MLSGRCDRRGALAALLAASAALGACSDGGGATRDAAPDVPTDTLCGADAFFTGELIDWDSTETRFCGVFNSTLTPMGVIGPGDMSNPNGRFELCLQRRPVTAIDVIHGTNQSQCTSTRDVYPVRALLFAQLSVIDAGGKFTARAMTQHRQDEMFDQIGAMYSAASAQLVVHVDGPQRQVTISTPAHDTTQKFDGAMWGAGDIGSDVFFPNVAPGSVEVSVAGNVVGAPVTLTLVAGAYHYVAVRAN